MTPQILQAVEEVLLQGQSFLEAVGPRMFTQKLEPPFAASLGEHYRHVLEHFICLLNGIGNIEVNYDARARDRELESNFDYARSVTASLIEAFTALPESRLIRIVNVSYAVSYNSGEAEMVESTIGREIMFCVGHAVHHYAILKLLAVQLGVQLPPEFGVAPSTLHHQRAATTA